MSTITIQLASSSPDMYEATCGPYSAKGKSAGEALDAIMPNMKYLSCFTVHVARFGGDQFFSDLQQARLVELSEKSKEGWETLSPEEVQEVEGLIDAQLEATILRGELRLAEKS